MKELSSANYQRIAKAIAFINDNFRAQPSLDEIAAEVDMSSFHFQRLFSQWAGVSPKKFIQFLSLDYAKQLLREEQASLLDVAYSTGLSGGGRLHDLFVKIEGMTPGEFKSGAKNLSINYSFAKSPFGSLIIATTQKGVCHLFFCEDEQQAFTELSERFPMACFARREDHLQQQALAIFSGDWSKLDSIKLHLKGTEFQLKVWQALLSIPSGRLSTYGELAAKINKPKASRAVGTAIANNPIAFLIPCHRVIQSSGKLGGYMWGPTRKAAMIGWEAAKSSTSCHSEGV